MTHRSLLLIGLLLAAVLLAVLARPVKQPPPGQPLPDSARAGRVVPNYDAVPPRDDIGFRTRERLLDHFRRHGRDLGADTPEEYEDMAQALRDRPAGGPVLEVVRADGVITRFDRGSGAFLAFDRDRTIRTCFRPADGEAYFRRQAARGKE